MTDIQYDMLKVVVKHLERKLNWAMDRITELENTVNHIENYLEETTDENCRCADEVRCEMKAEIERLRELTENDEQEIGSYLKGTGLRGENQRLRDALERIEARGLELISEHVGGSAASYVAQELTAIARETLEETK